MRNYGGYDFGPSLRKPSMKKQPTELMKKSRKQLKKTRQYYMLSMANTYNNSNRQGDGNDSKRETSHVTIVARTNNSTCSSRPSNGMKSSHANIEISMPTSSRIVRKKTRSRRPSNGMESSHQNMEKSMPSSLRIVRKNTEMSRPKNGVVSSRRTTKSSLSPNTGMTKSRASSSRPDNRRDSLNNTIRSDNRLDSLNKNTNGGPLPLKNIEKPTFSLRLKNNEASVSKNSEMPRSSSSRPNDDMVFAPTNIKKPNNGLVPLRGNKELSKSRPSLLSNGFSVLKDESNSMFGISKESHPSSIFGNSRIAVQMVNGEAPKELIPTMLETSNLSLKLKGNQDNIGISHVSLLGNNLSSHQMAEVTCMVTNKERHVESLAEHIRHEYTHEDDDSEELENCRPTKRRRRLILNNYEEDDDVEQNLPGVEIGTVELTTQTSVVKDSVEVSNPFLSESLKLQQYGSLPIDEPVWRGIINISRKKNVPLAAHLSTKCCEEAWNLAKSLQQEIVVTKLSRLEAWPQSFEASRPTDDNIALYFLPCEMRQDADLDQLVKEVAENDMVLQAFIGEAEMLMFPSILLPEQHKTFQGKPYLWAVFKRRNKVASVEGKQQGKGCCAEDGMGKHQASHSSGDKEGHRVARLNTDTGPEAPEEMERQGMEQEENSPLAGANTPSPATRDPTMNATTSANHGQIHSSLPVPTGALFGFVVQHNPRIEQLIQDLQREGAVVVAMRGEMLGSGLGQAAASSWEDRMSPSSS